MLMSYALLDNMCAGTAGVENGHQHAHVLHCARCTVFNNTAICYHHANCLKGILHMLASAMIPAVGISVRFLGLQFLIVQFCHLSFPFFFHAILR